MAVFWMRHCDVYSGVPESDVDFIAFDGDQIIGRVLQFPFGPETGVWFWTMTQTRPGPPLPERDGRVSSRGEASRRVVEAYELLLAAPATNPPKGWRMSVN